MNILETISENHLSPRGVIQVGSHHGEEIPIWASLGVRQMHFEPIEANLTELTSRHPGVLAIPFALGNFNGRAMMHTEMVNGGQSCSILKPKTHLDVFPWIKFTGTEEVEVRRLDDLRLYLGDYNFMYIDAQGYELEILKGAEQSLSRMEFIFTEVNAEELYEGCAFVGQIDLFMLAHDFHRRKTVWHGGTFGDALYVLNT